MKKQHLRVLFNQYVLASITLALLFASYMIDSQITSLMDFTGWTFFLTSCLTHAAIIMLVPFLVIGLPLTLCKVPARISGSIIALLHAIVFIMVVINRFVFSIGDIFVFDTSTYVRSTLYIIAIIVFAYVLLWLAFRLNKHSVRHFTVTSLCVLLGAALLSQGIHAYSGIHKMRPVMESKEMIPYYFPVRMNTVIIGLGLATDESVELADFGDADTSFLNYPLAQYLSLVRARPALYQPFQWSQ